MSWDATDCFVVESSEIVFKDATSVACNAAFDYWGTPVYSGGAYDTGCQECDEDLGCPTSAPSPSPTVAPSGSPTSSPTAAPTASPTQASITARCTDNVLNGDESSVDCGGGLCRKCVAGQMCEDGPRDCRSGVCAIDKTCAVVSMAAPTTATGGLRQTGAPTTDDAMSTKTRLGLILGGAAGIVFLTFVAKMSKSSADKRAEKDRKFVRRHTSARLSGGVGDLTANPMRSSSPRSREQAPSEPGGGAGGEGIELVANI